MIKADMAAKEMETGLNAICSWCEHWHEANNRRTEGEEVDCGKSCGGPAMGRGFPMYKGPLHGYLDRLCFICGKGATSGVQIGGRLIGVCNRMGPKKETCLDKLRNILARTGQVVAKEIVVPVVGDNA